VEGGGYGGRYTPFFPLYMSPYLPIFAVKPGFIWPVTRGSYSIISATLSVFRLPSASVSAKLGQKALFSQGLSDVVSAYVSAFSSRICLCICHLPQTTGRTLSYLPLYLPSTTNDWQNSLFACPFIIFIEHGSSSLSRTVIVRVHTRTESSFTDGTSPSPE
jgi:hypothetical protein